MSKSTTNLGKVGAVVLCGGLSQRMGIDKWRLDVGSLTLLEFILAKLDKCCSPIAISVADINQSLPGASLPAVLTVADQVKGSGPLEGIRASLAALEPHCEFAFVTACDVPHVSAEVVEFLLSRIGEAEAIVPVKGDRRFGMTSLLRTAAHRKLKTLVDRDQLRVSYMVDALDCVELAVEELQQADEQLLCLTNINTPEQYIAFLADQGLEVSEEMRKLFDDMQSD